MLRRLACAPAGSRVGAGVITSSSSLSCSHVLAGAPSRYMTATLPLLSTPQRTFFSRSNNEAKKNEMAAKQSATATASSTAAAATAAQVFATNEKVKLTSTSTNSAKVEGAAEDACKASSSGSSGSSLAQKEQESAAPATTAAPASGIRSIGIKLSEDDELVRAFNNFSKTVNGCTQEEFLVGVKQAYAGLAVVISAFVEKAQQPLVGLTESSKIIAAASEASKMLDQEFKLEDAAKTSSTAAAAAEKEASATGAATAALKTDSAVGSRLAGAAPSVSTSPKMKLQDTLVQHVVSTITSIIPVSTHLAESIFKIWMLQKEKQVNLSSIASPADYVLDSKLVIFARLDKARIYFNSDNIGAEVDVTLNNDYLRKLDPNVTSAPTSADSQTSSVSSNVKDGARGHSTGSTAGTSKKVEDDDDLDEGMIQVLTDTNANAQRVGPAEHTFVVDKKTRTLTSKKTNSTYVPGAQAAASFDASTVTPEDLNAEPKAKGNNTISRVQVTCVAASESDAAAAKAAAASTTASNHAATDSGKSIINNKNNSATSATTAAEAQKGDAAAAAVVDPDDCSVFIKVNGNALPPIPADARACALLTMDVVVPPERYAYNFEWFYKRIVGYENEYERIAAARVFASNSPKSLGNFLDFVMRMITGKSVEFMFSKSIGRMIGIPEDVSETPPATRKLMCMYMDASHKWVLADLITLAPVIETKLPKA